MQFYFKMNFIANYRQLLKVCRICYSLSPATQEVSRFLVTYCQIRNLNFRLETYKLFVYSEFPVILPFKPVASFWCALF
jgi:hypothetical protein